MKKAALVLICLFAAGSFAASARANKPAGAQCWTSTSQLALGDSYSLSASGLPTNGQLNLVVMYPNGNMLTSPFTSNDGSFSAQSTSSTMVQATQAGTYTFKFVGKVNWPSGSWNKEYATCSMQVG